jgi:ribosome biogenesis GTPase
MQGVVIRAYGKFFEVRLRDEPRVLLSTLKGTLKRERRRTDLVAVGDHVSVIDVGEGEGQIESVQPRVRSLKRRARQTDDVEQIILANPDQALFLFSIARPAPHRRMLDRFLVLAESQGLPSLIGVNKIDLDQDAGEDAVEAVARHLFDDYVGLYDVHFLSVRTGTGLDRLQRTLAGKVTVVAGPSGAGKSSLLNALDGSEQRLVGSISDATGKGRHTTTSSRLYDLGGDPPTFVADTPGVRALALHGVDPGELDGFFPEFRPYLGHCRYPDCSHLHEPDCRIREAVARDDIHAARYESYASMRRGDQE